MPYDLSIHDDAIAALENLGTYGDSPLRDALRQWADRLSIAPSFGPPGFIEADAIRNKYGGNAGATVRQVNQLHQALGDLADVSARIAGAYRNADHDPKQAIKDLTEAMTSGLSTVDTDLKSPGSSGGA